MLLASLLLAMNVIDADEPPAPPREFRGVWIATVDNIDWPSERGIPAEKAKAELIQALDRAEKLNLNTIILQVRPMGDALYQSAREPWSEFLTGQQGEAPEPMWDPLITAVEEGHKRGLKVHAWINPYRAWHPAAKGSASPLHITQSNPECVVRYGKFEWMNPGLQSVEDYSINTILDIAKRYDIDGVHMDDYFYPYPEGNADFPDKAAYSAFVSAGGNLDIRDWRRENVNRFVKRLNIELHRVKPWIEFGISPFGVYRPGIPPGITAGIDQYDDLYADCLHWLRQGWCDYFVPQLYWKIDKAPQSFKVLAKWWTRVNSRHRHVFPGILTSNLLASEGNWDKSEIINQIAITRNTKANGQVHFSDKVFRIDPKGIRSTLLNGPYSRKAIPPPSPWLDQSVPLAPVLLSKSISGSTKSVAWRPTGPVPVHEYALYAKINGKWMYSRTVPSDTTAWEGTKVEKLAISGLNRAHEESYRLVVDLR